MAEGWPETLGGHTGNESTFNGGKGVSKTNIARGGKRRHTCKGGPDRRRPQKLGGRAKREEGKYTRECYK